MKKLLGVMLAVFISSSIFSQGIEFEHGTFAEALAKAKKENKMVFMDCYTKWCGPCKKLAKNIFPQQEVGKYFNENFVNVKMDMESEAGKELKNRYNVSAFPTLLWLDAGGNIQHRSVGASSGGALIATANLALDTKNNLGSLIRQYENGSRSPEFIEKYVLALTNAGVENKDVTDSYFSGKKPEELINAKDFKLIKSIIKNSSHPMFRFVVENEEKFAAVVGEKQLDAYMVSKMFADMMQLEYDKDLDGLDEKRKELIELGGTGRKAVDYFDMMRLGRGADRLKYHQASLDYASKYEFNNPDRLSDLVRSIAGEKEEVTKEILEQALELSKRAVELDPKYAYIDAYAHLLYKLGRVEEAKEQALKAVEMFNNVNFPEVVRKDLSKTLWSVRFLNEKK